MSDSWSWAKRIFNLEDLLDLANKTDNVLYDNENGFVVHITLSNEQCMDLVEHFFTIQEAKPDEFHERSYEYIDGFMSNFVYFLQDYLDTQHQGWEQRRYGIEE